MVDRNEGRGSVYDSEGGEGKEGKDGFITERMREGGSLC